MTLTPVEQQIYDLIESIQTPRAKGTIDPLLELLGRLGNPHLRLPPTIHVAGTNGKGSTLAFLDSILRLAGFKVHRYTSPHIVSVCERIQVANHEIKPEAFLAILEEIVPHTTDLHLTFFDLVTAVAFVVYAQNPADYLLLETGLGGRFDATNVIANPVACIITQIGLDHMDVMGADLNRIAWEKAGIMKPGVPVFTHNQDPAVMEVLKNEANQLRCPFHLITDESRYELGLLGPHQQQNALLAVAVARYIEIAEDVIKSGLKQAQWPGRMHKVQYHGREVWLDMAHNASAAKQAVESMGQMGLTTFHLVFSLRQSKDLRAFMQAFKGHTLSITYIPLPAYAQGHTIEDIRSIDKDCLTGDSLVGIYNLPEGPILVTGSAVLLGEILGQVS